jgi:ArsR family metal-binding transcriptional regulator
MTLLETACLDFCIKLLNQKTKVHKYKSLLVYKMAVLGCSEQGWCNADSYLLILLYILKVACFLII